jgi:integrase/recombinase XerD
MPEINIKTSLKYNPENERVKKQYEEALIHGRHREARTVEAVWRAINMYEKFTDRDNFKSFNVMQAKGFKRWLAKQENAKGQPLSLSTVRSTLANIRDFFSWLVTHPNYIRKVDGRGVDFLRLSANQDRAGRATREKTPPTAAEVRKVLKAMPFDSDVEKRDKAIIAFTLLTGVRDGALISLKFKDVDLERKEVWQDPKHVKTKNRKGITSQFIPIEPLAEEVFLDWMAYYQNELGAKPEDALFPKQEIINNPETLQFEASKLSTDHWANATPVRDIFHKAFIAVELPKCQPHTIRNTIVTWAMDNCSQLQFKAISQSLGHEHAMTSYNSYGTLQHHDVRKAFTTIGKSSSGLSSLTTDALLAELKNRY